MRDHKVKKFQSKGQIVNFQILSGKISLTINFN